MFPFMKKTPVRQRRARAISETKLEIHPDAQRRFERAVDAAVKSGPIHRKPIKKA